MNPNSRYTAFAIGVSYSGELYLDVATLERDRPYLVPLIEELRLPGEIRVKTSLALSQAARTAAGCAHVPRASKRRKGSQTIHSPPEERRQTRSRL